MIITKIISTIFVGLLLSIGLWIACYISLIKMYPKYSLQIRHHIFSLIIAIATFVLYCFFSSISTTISGIEHTLNSVKEVIVEKSDIVDNITATLSSGSNRQTAIDETYNSILLTLNTNGELNNYIRDMDFSKFDTKDIVDVLNTSNMPEKEKSLRVIDKLFDSYITEFTKSLKMLWWGLLIAMIILQLAYWGIMLYKAENRSGRNRTNKSLPTLKANAHTGRSSNYRFKR